MKNDFIGDFEYFTIDVNKGHFLKINEIKLVDTDDGHKEVELDFNIILDLTKTSMCEVSDSPIKIKHG